MIDRTIFRRATLAGAAALAMFGLASPAFAQKTKLTVYTALENDQLDPFKKAFEADNPTIEIAWVRDSTGVVAAKLMAEKDNKPVPTSWADLIKPEYKDSIVMPNPASSGTGYLTIAAWLQIMGEEAGWKYMDALHQNIAQYIHSGSAPCVQAAKGERLIGIGLDTRGASEKTKGAPLELVIPKEGLGWELEVTAIVKGTKNLDAAKKLADWAASKKANELYAKTYPIVAYPGVAITPPNYPPNLEKVRVKRDVEWMAMNRDRILAEWTKRYDGKSAPKAK